MSSAQITPENQNENEVSVEVPTTMREQKGRASGQGIWSNLPSYLIRFAVLLSLFICVLMVTFIGLCATESGTKKILQLAQYASGGALSISGISGSLARQLQIDELTYIDTTSKFKASGIKLEWSPWALLHRQLELETLQVSSIKLASAPDPTPTQIPENLQLPIALHVKSAAIGSLLIADLLPDGNEHAIVRLTAITASLSSTEFQHKIAGAVSSPWGALQLQTVIQTSKPFKLKGEFSYRGQLNPAMPNLGIQGSAQGSLLELSLQGKAIADQAAQNPTSAKNAVLQGGFETVLAPFASQPIRSLHADIAGLNPADFASSAPQAQLHVRANLSAQQVTLGAEKKPAVVMPPLALTGHIAIENTQPARIDQQGLPLLSFDSDLHWDQSLIELKGTQLKLPGNGKVSGNARIQLAAIGLPLLESRFDLSGINLAQIDKHIQASNISGSLQAQTRSTSQGGTILTLQTRLTESRASLNAEASYHLNDAADVLKLEKFELLSGSAQMRGQGEFSFSNKQKFNFQGELRRFDPARWIAGPAGNIDADLSVIGQLQTKLSLQVQLPRLQGSYAGQPLSGVLQLNLLESAALEISKMDLHWGKNSISGQGIWGSGKDGLQLKLDAPDLPALSSLLDINLTGSAQAELQLHGKISDPSAKLHIAAQGLGIEKQLHLAKLSADIDLENALQGGINAQLQVQEIRTKTNSDNAQLEQSVANAVKSAEHKKTVKLPLLAEQALLTIKGRRELHQIDGNLRFNAVRQLQLNASGGVKMDQSKPPLWAGQLQRLSISGHPDLKLATPMSIEAGAQLLKLGSAQFDGALGSLALEKFEWTPGQMKTRGKIDHLKVLELVNLVKPQSAVDGDLQVGVSWDLQLKDNIRGELNLQRQSGDVRVRDVDGTGKPLALEMKELQLSLALGGLIAGTDAERLSLKLDGAGKLLGNWHLNANSQVSKKDERWVLASNAALEGRLNADVPDLQWLGPWLNPGLALKGKLLVDASLAGILSAPKYQAQIDGRDLEVAFASEGLLLPNGILSAQLDEKQLKLKQLQFSNKITTMPQHAKFRDAKWLGQKGEFNAAGEIDWSKQSGSIEAKFQKFPVLQRKDRWLVVSGEASIKQTSDIWALVGNITTDGAYFKLPKSPPPSLSSDVIVKRGAASKAQADSAGEEKKAIKTRVDVNFDMGERFVFTGSGLDTGLAGSIRLRSSDGSPLQATGSIRTVGGVYEGYGQQLDIERGILNFQGSPSNPGLNIRALRTGLEVEAGVEVVGTVSSPQVRLVSEPVVPDAEKLSWLVLGRGSNQLGGSDASLLMSAASTIFGGDGSRNVPREIVQGIGFDEFSIGTADVGGGSKLPAQTVAGSTSVGSSSGDQVVSVGKRLLPGLVLSVERGLSDASGAVKLSWQLTRRISVIARSGTEASLDAYYTFSFH
ncbi:translocation/assembly module TamB domain-containing protein [Undibacterium sp.]|uniref:translocation/assembly module TamB domain-containing protein n=1 Tax=Undibacterium sp. TaxID=1914977 RepID=UPI0025E46D1A|nr:translocation/assembly module TamB domain-containing protein [Undibacterium sp.]